MRKERASNCSIWTDLQMAELKEFVGGVVQKLPQPCKLVVVGGAKSTMQLHFACARTGETVTTETKEWGQWCKVGFGLLKVSNVLRMPPPTRATCVH